MYALKIKFNFANGSRYDGGRKILIQGYNEMNSNWEDISDEIEWIGSGAVINEKAVNLNSAKSYSKYRLYVKDVINTGSSYGVVHSGLSFMQLYGKNK